MKGWWLSVLLVLLMSSAAGAVPPAGYGTSWVGGTFPGVGSPVCGADWSKRDCGHIEEFGARNVPGAVYDIAVTPDGTVWTTQYYDEGHMTSARIRNGALLGWPQCLKTGDPDGGGWAAAVNAHYVFLASVIPSGEGSHNPQGGATAINRFNFDGTQANFVGGTGYGDLTGQFVGQTSGGQLCANAVEVEGPRSGAGDTQNAIWGMAASPTELYVSDSVSNSIKVYTIASMTLARSFALAGGARPGRLVYNPNDNSLWIAQHSGATGNMAAGGTAFPIRHYSTTGTLLGGSITSVAVPMAMHMRGATILIADAGRGMNIKEFNASGTQIGTLGITGGMLSSNGVYAATRLMYPAGLGVDGANNVYVAEQYFTGNYGAALSSGGGFVDITYGSDIRSFTPAFTALNWKVFSHTFQQPVAADPANDGATVYNAVASYGMNYSNNNPGGEQTWNGITLDLVDYPNDPFHLKVWFGGPVRVVSRGAYKYAFWAGNSVWGLTRQRGNFWVPMSLFLPKWYPNWANGIQPTNGNSAGYIWNDTSGDGEPQAGEFSAQIPSNGPGVNFYTEDCHMDGDLDVWCSGHYTGLARYPHSGPNGPGLLHYAQSSVVWYGTPPGFSKVERADYVAATDTLYVSGFSAASPDPGGELNNTSTGNTLARYNNFLAYWVAHRAYPSPQWTTAIEFKAPAYVGMNIRVAGNYVFVDNNSPVWRVSPNPIPASTWDIRAYRISNGTLAGNIWPGAAVNYWSGNYDDTIGAFSVYQRRTDGQYLIFQQNELNGTDNLYRGLLQNFVQN
jgi:hypothetical protein